MPRNHADNVDANIAKKDVYSDSDRFDFGRNTNEPTSPDSEAVVFTMTFGGRDPYGAADGTDDDGRETVTIIDVSELDVPSAPADVFGSDWLL